MGKQVEGRLPGIFRTAMDKAALWSRINSPWLVHFNSGSCNGCDIEILATLAPRYDLERFGVKLQGSPRHADVLICTGPVTRQARDRLLRTYEQMPAPKFVIAVGSCSISGGAFHGCYNIVGDVGDVIPVDVYIPGCPPRPEAIIYGVAVAGGLVDKKVAPVTFKQLEMPIPRYHPADLSGRDEMVVYEKVDKI
jgi:NADH-quinone oxidoreductase B subunit